MAMVSFAGAQNYSGPFEGAGSDLFPFQGYTFGRIAKVTTGKARDSGNETLKLEVVSDEDAAKGMRVIKVQPVTGMRKDGKPNAQGVQDILYSIYTGTEGSHDAALARIKTLDGQEISTDDLIQDLVGAQVWFEVNARKYQRDDGSDAWCSEIRNFVGKQRYEDAVAINSAHRNNPAEASRNPTTAPVATPNGSTGAVKSAATANKIL